MAALQPQPLLDLLDRSTFCDRARDLAVVAFRNLKSAKLFPYELLSLKEYRERFEVFSVIEWGGTDFVCPMPMCICRDKDQIYKYIRNGLDQVERSVKSNCLDCIMNESTGATASVARSCRVSHLRAT